MTIVITTMTIAVTITVTITTTITISWSCAGCNYDRLLQPKFCYYPPKAHKAHKHTTI